MEQQATPNRVLIQSEVYVASRIAATQEDHHFGVDSLWDLTAPDGSAIPRGLVRWFDSAGGGWGFWRGGPDHRVRLTDREVLWLEVDDAMRRWLASHQMPPALLDAVRGIARAELGIAGLAEQEDAVHEVSATGLRRALERAYMEGMGE